jgi:hypothetical protein
MSFETEMEKKIAENPEIISCSDIPEKVFAKVRDYTFKTDSKGNQALFITLLTKDNKRIIQKYMPSSYVALNKAFEKCGKLSTLMVQMVVWKKEKLGQMVLPRLVPVPNSKETDMAKAK